MEYVLDVSRWDNLLAAHDYDQLGQIGAGSFSDVFAVRSKSTGKSLAAKRMVARRSIMSDPKVAAEIQCLSKLSLLGTCIIRLEGLIMLDRLVCMMLELAPFGDLEKYAKEHWPLPERLVSNATRQVLSALAHCHRQYIAHRDVNPANVLLISSGCVRLADFGLAVCCRDSAGRQLLCEDYLGRDSYQAPEVLWRTPHDAIQADLWSMGSLGLFLLTGKHPLPGKLSLPAILLCDGKSILQNYSLSSLSNDSRRPDGDAQGYLYITASGCESEGGCCSERYMEEPLQLDVILDSGGEIFPNSQLNSVFDVDVTMELNLSKETNLIESSLTRLVSQLCVQKPTNRMKSEDALDFWKKSLSRRG